MDIEQAKKKLASIRSSTATKHPKTLICELCDVVKFLLDEIDRIRTPKMTVLKQPFDPHTPPKTSTHPFIPCQPPWPDKQRKDEPPWNERPLNAGDAE